MTGNVDNQEGSIATKALIPHQTITQFESQTLSTFAARWRFTLHSLTSKQPGARTPSHAQVELDMGSSNNTGAIKKLEAVLAEHVASKKREFKEVSLWVFLAGPSQPLKSVLNAVIWIMAVCGQF